MYTFPFMASSLSTRSASSSRRLSVSITMFLLIFLIPKRPSQHHPHFGGAGGSESSRTGGIGISLANAAPDDDEAESTLRALFIADIKQLLTHNQRFYNAYGRKDGKVDMAFDEAKIAANVIFLYPEIFRYKIQDINQRITEALAKKDMDMKGETGVTADGVTVFFVDKGVLLLGVMGGFVRFPE